MKEPRMTRATTMLLGIICGCVFNMVWYQELLTIMTSIGAILGAGAVWVSARNDAIKGPKDR